MRASLPRKMTDTIMGGMNHQKKEEKEKEEEES
jgi:hypothetical protein